MLTDNNHTPDVPLTVVADTFKGQRATDRERIADRIPRLQQNAEKLRNVAHQVEAFLIRQIDRLQVELQQAETAGRRGDIEELSEEFEQMKQKWDAERQVERNRLQEDSQRLAEAWKRLEAEQREMLKYRVPNKLAGSGVARTNARPVGPLSPTQSVTAASETHLACSSVGGVATATSHKNQLQFQQLRREMMEHARQRRNR